MKKFLKNITYFIFPFLIYYFLIYFIDPFNYYNKNIEISRINIIAKDTEPHLYKLIDFKHNPKNNILLGDSRTNGLYGAFGENKIKFWSNLAYGGASLNEMIQTFWHVTNTKKIDSVLIGVNFNHFNSNNTRNWIKPSLRLTENPISYSFSKYVYLSIVSFSKYVYLSIVKFLRKPDTKNKTEKTIILIGPEGDFSTKEIELALENEFNAVNLAKTRLRTETAGIIAVHTINII